MEQCQRPWSFAGRSLTGNGGNDTLRGGLGNDTYSGQPGRWAGHDLGERQYAWQQ
jgi:hemolysin type calcium-binding protein